MESQMFEILDMKLSFTQDQLKELCFEVVAAYPTNPELAYVARPKSIPVSPGSKNARSRSPDAEDLPKRKKAKFLVEEDEESDDEAKSDFEDDETYLKSELEDSYVYPSPPQLSSSPSSSSSVVTPPEEPSVKLVRSRAAVDLRVGFKTGSPSYSPLSPFSPTIEVPMVNSPTAMKDFAQSTGTGWQLFHWIKSSPWVAATRYR